MKKYNICILGNVEENNIMNSYSWFVKTVYDGFTSLGHNVFGLNYRKNNLDKIWSFLFSTNIDILFTHLTFHKAHDISKIMEIFDDLRRLKNITIIHTLQDAREEPRHYGDISHGFDLVLVSQYKNIPKFENYWNIPVYYWPYSALTQKHLDRPIPELKFNIPVFTGNKDSHKDRKNFINLLQKYQSIKVFKTGSKNDKRKVSSRLSVSTPAILGLSTRYNWSIDGYIDVRPWQYLGQGACMICRPHIGQDRLIPPDLYYTIPDYTDSSARLVKEYFQEILKIDTWPMRKEVFEYIQRYHSSKERMKNTLEVVEGKKSKIVDY